MGAARTAPFLLEDVAHVLDHPRYEEDEGVTVSTPLDVVDAA